MTLQNWAIRTNFNLTKISRLGILFSKYLVSIIFQRFFCLAKLILYVFIILGTKAQLKYTNKKNDGKGKIWKKSFLKFESKKLWYKFKSSKIIQKKLFFDFEKNIIILTFKVSFICPIRLSRLGVRFEIDVPILVHKITSDLWKS